VDTHTHNLFTVIESDSSLTSGRKQKKTKILIFFYRKLFLTGPFAQAEAIDELSPPGDIDALASCFHHPPPSRLVVAVRRSKKTDVHNILYL